MPKKKHFWQKKGRQNLAFRIIASLKQLNCKLQSCLDLTLLYLISLKQGSNKIIVLPAPQCSLVLSPKKTFSKCSLRREACCSSLLFTVCRQVCLAAALSLVNRSGHYFIPTLTQPKFTANMSYTSLCLCVNLPLLP
jgi:hypothetical protein